MERRYFIELAFRGTAYNGWQVQPNAIGIQQILEEKLALLLKENLRITGAGRTDTGVHATYFVAHFDTGAPLEGQTGELVRKLNHMLPDDISVLNIFPVEPDDHSRFSAISRTYRYYVNTRKNPFRIETSYRVWAIPDAGAMNLAAAELPKYDDFRSFCRSNSGVKTYICNVTEAGWEVHDGMLIFTITADRFLRNMVRAITGTLLDVGFGRTSIEGFREIIAARDRRRAGMSAPACGLVLTAIKYPDHIPVSKNPFVRL